MPKQAEEQRRELQINELGGIEKIEREIMDTEQSEEDLQQLMLRYLSINFNILGSADNDFLTKYSTSNVF